MSARILVQEVLEAFPEAYKTIDVRTAAILEGDVWTNGLTVVRLTYEDREAIEKKHRELHERHGRAETPHFKIVMEAVESSRWEEFARSCAEGVIRLKDVEVRLTQGVALTQPSDIRKYPGDIRQPYDWKWPSVEFWSGRYRAEKLGESTLTREVNSLGWSNTYQAINVLCEINVSLGKPSSYDFYLSVPVFVLLSDIRISTTENRLFISLVRHRSITDIELVAVFKDRLYDTEIVRGKVGMPTEPARSGEAICETTSSIVVAEVHTEQLIEVKAIHPKLGDVDSIQRPARDLIPEAERNILFAALRYICGDGQLQDVLVRPYELKPKKLKESAAFELHVAWALGLLGFSTVVLGECEKILARQTKVERASVDILAASGKTLAVVACTIRTPKEEDFTNLLHACEILSRDVFVNTTVRVLPMVFTGAIGYAPYRELEDRLGIIPIVDVDRLDILLDLLKRGNEQQFLQFLSSPQYYELRRPEEE